MKPKDADYFRWDKFVQWARRSGISLDHPDDWRAWWECWKAGFLCAADTVARRVFDALLGREEEEDG